MGSRRKSGNVVEGKLRSKDQGKVLVTLFQRWFEFKITLWRVLGERAAT